MRLTLLSACLGLVFLLALPARAQCQLVRDPLMGIGVINAYPKGDTVIVNTVWKGHETDRVIYYEKKKRGAKSASMLLQKADGTIQGIYNQDNTVYYVIARNLEDFKAQKGTFVAKKIRSVWYLPLDSKEPDDEAWSFILTQHLEKLYPLEKPRSGDSQVKRRVYAQAESEDGARADCEAYARQICDKAKIKKTQVEMCDEGLWYVLEYDFGCE